VVQHVVEHDVEARRALGEVLAGVVDDIARAVLLHLFDVAGTEHAGDLGPE
jgi:hypothetical protein